MSRGYKGNITNDLKVRLAGGLSHPTDQFLDRVNHINQYISSSYSQPTQINDFIRFGMSQSFDSGSASGSYLYPDKNYGGSSWWSCNTAYATVQLKVRNLPAGATSSFEFSYKPGVGNQFIMCQFPRQWGRDATGASVIQNSYQKLAANLYCTNTAVTPYQEGGTRPAAPNTPHNENDVFGFYFYGDQVHYAKNGVVWTSGTTNTFDDYPDEDYMILTLPATGETSDTSHWHNIKVTGETKPFSFEHLFAKQFNLPLKEGHYVGDSNVVNVFYSGSDTTNWPDYDDWQGNYIYHNRQGDSWKNGWSVGSSTTATASFTGSTGGIVSYRHATYQTDPANQMFYFFGPVGDGFTPTTTNNYTQLDPGFYVNAGKPGNTFYGGAQKVATNGNLQYTFPSGSRLAVVLTGSNWGGSQKAGEEGNVAYWLYRPDSINGGATDQDYYSYDWHLIGRWHCLFPGTSMEMCFGAYADWNRTLELKYGGNVHE